MLKIFRVSNFRYLVHRRK